MIHIFTAYTPEYQEMATLQKNNSEMLGYKHTGVEIKTRNCVGKSSESIQSTAIHKPSLFLQMMEEYPKDFLLYMDSDVIPIDHIDDIIPGVINNVVLTQRINGDITSDTSDLKWLGMINAGVIGMGVCEYTKNFVKKWKFELENNYESDQQTLNHMCWTEPQKCWKKFDAGYVFDATHFFDIEPDKHLPDNCYISLIPSHIYNYYFIGDSSKARVLHFKGHARKFFDSTKSKIRLSSKKVRKPCVTYY